jgi:hypothetical protein
LRAALPGLHALLARLQAAEAADAEQATAMAEAPGAAASQRLDTVALHAALTELAGLLANFDMRATDLVSSLRQQAGPTHRLQLQALDDAVGALDFERAAPLCQELLAETRP